MKKTIFQPRAKTSTPAMALCSLALAVATVFATPANAITAPDIDKPPATLDEAKANVTATSSGPSDTKAVAERDLRSKAMKEAASSYGARSGLLRGNWETREALKKVAPTYDVLFNFSTLMLLDQQPVEKGGDGRARLIRPPVVVQARNAFNQLDPRMINERDAVYRLETNVAFASAPPNWRTYLYRDVGETVAALPHFSLMPRTSEEKSRWDGWVSEGWQAGYLQAKAIREADLNRLARDFEGMVLYYDLVAQHVLSLPLVAARNDGVTGDDNNMNVNDITLRITVIPAFQRHPKDWVTIATDPTPDRIGQSRQINAERAVAKRKNQVLTSTKKSAAAVNPASVTQTPDAQSGATKTSEVQLRAVSPVKDVPSGIKAPVTATE